MSRVKELLEYNGYSEELIDEIVVFENYSYATAFIGVTEDNRAVYDFNKMIEFLLNTGDFKTETEAIEWIECNTIRSLGYVDNAPIIVNILEDYNE